jgi:asparagine synthetase B (glutamine-hydrolysing)
MASYDFWGVRFLNKFNGMGVFVIYDNKEDKFFIPSSRFEKKTIFL